MEMLTLLSIGFQFSQGHIFLIALTWAMTESPLPSRTGLKTPRHWSLSPIQEPLCWVRDWLGPEQTLYPDLPGLALAPKNSEANSKNRIGAMEKTWRKETAFSTVHWMGLCLGVGSLWPPGVWPPECTGLKEQYSRNSQHRKWVLPWGKGVKGDQALSPHLLVNHTSLHGDFLLSGLVISTWRALQVTRECWKCLSLAQSSKKMNKHIVFVLLTCSFLRYTQKSN